MANIDLDSNGSILQNVDYLPFGQVRTEYNYGDYDNKYKFTGKERDTESNLDYFEARYYGSDNGRFRSIDRVFWEVGETQRGAKGMYEPQQLNSFSYVRNNPLRYTDPTGEFIDTIWDIGNVVYDAGRILKNTIEAGTGLGYAAYGYATGNEYIVDAGLNGVKENWKELGEAAFDTGTDALATAIPGVPAGGSKIARITDNVVKYTNKQYTEMASNLGYKEIKGEYSHGQKIFYNSKTKKYITGDADQHNGGVWKMAGSINNLGSKNRRSGTYDKDLNKIGD